MTVIYKDAHRPIAERVADLLSRMTTEEKFAQMHAYWLVLAENGDHRERSDMSDEFAGVSEQTSLAERLKLGVGQITRPLGTHIVDAQSGVRAANRLQKMLIEETRLGIPALFHEECLVGLLCKDATLFPSSLNYGSTWDPELVERAAREIGAEARSTGCKQGLAPVLDVSRDVRWGRTEETFGEDPWLVGVMACAYVNGLQSEKRDLLATLKHYVGHSFSEGARNHAPVHLGFCELNDTFLLPFEMAVKLANAGSVMPAYHDIDNQPGHSDSFLLTTVLREQWGFDGIIVADYGGVSLLHQHHGISHDAAESAALAFNAGLDVELPKDDCARHLREALDRGLMTMAKIDEIVARTLTEKFRLGLFEQPYTDVTGIVLQSASARQAARDVATRSLTLLENRGAIPLSDKPKVAVVGPTADDPLALLSGYSFPVHLIISDMVDEVSQVTTPLAALRQYLGEEQVSYAKGCHIIEQRMAGAPVFPGDSGGKPMQQSPVSLDVSLIPDAVSAARESDVVVACVGDLAGLFQSGTVGEGSDTDSLNLPGVQQQLLEALVGTGKPVIVVMTGGRPYNLQGLEDSIAGLLMAWAPGQEGGWAIADVLTGRAEPQGRLVVSVPKSAGAMPYYYNHKLKSGGTPFAFHFGSRYPFGYGQSWTTFDYAEPHLLAQEVNVEGEIAVQVAVRNSGERRGSEVVQLYVRDKVASMVRPLQELKAFQRVTLDPGETATLSFYLPVDMLNFTRRDGQRIVEPGEFELQIGASSADIRGTATVTVKGEVRELPRDWRMMSRCEVS
ncbi:glycoside hydrolase family 3 C-terminal domain-containing protein [Klebsiella sp. RHBSTW-00484]|uniref:glycoside hydrolase family 3 N-terminal domain-containing protein n=1 Tax=unclassified Klebsiella TaxID=2608929 RepID=UPI0015E52F19|nr:MULTISPECIES: glycoside hydrolase family 3 N-terminal domain-containing protein [unclassified Klebsiella]MBA7847541.1 glycoside hydrolase family 3 C-terminal domain-containing protein [Klebsiella sp. RHBSTW-00465]QLO36579.1 glycoside hydrolase family 3 C-terminal domain-containing protein [Klebsiella sp. RHBSTW-00484]QLT76098.1 glycoside hydrolase family 3 C-terminal domain-containing protein [Klebsiella sp. RHBSTW-00464]